MIKGFNNISSAKLAYLFEIPNSYTQILVIIDAMKNFLEPIREKRKHYVEHPEEVKQILEEGTAKAKAKATETVKNVKKAMKLDY